MSDLTIPEPVASFFETVNRRDEASFLDAFTPEGDWRSTHANGRSTFVFSAAGDKLTQTTIREG